MGFVGAGGECGIALTDAPTPGLRLTQTAPALGKMGRWVVCGRIVLVDIHNVQPA